MPYLDLPPKLKAVIPTDPASQAALNLAIEHLQTPILNHSLRVFFYAQELLTRGQNPDRDSKLPPFPDPSDLPLVFVAAILHDIGTTEKFNGNARFEVEGGDAAKDLLKEHGWSEEQSHQVWIAIAIHASPGIAERIFPLSSLIRTAVKIDFTKSYQQLWETEDLTKELESDAVLPRLEAEKCLADAVVAQARTSPSGEIDKEELAGWGSEKHPNASWPGGLLKAKIQWPDYDGINPAF